MKESLKKIAGMMSEWPIIGPIVGFSIALAGLPKLRAAYLDLNHRQHVFETQQLPILLKAASSPNLDMPNTETDNLIASLPVALRKIARDFADMRTQLETTLHSTSGLSERLEFVRRELMLELRYGAAATTGSEEHSRTDAEIINPDKLHKARNSQVRLNLGCGHLPLDGYLNIDRRKLPGVDIAAELDDLPFQPGEVDEISSAHVLEHFPNEQLRRALLPYFSRLLKPGGKFHAVVPDGEAMMLEYANGCYPYEALREVMFGAQDYAGDFHFNMFTPASLRALLEEAGFANICLIDQARRNGNCFEFEMHAFKESAI